MRKSLIIAVCCVLAAVVTFVATKWQPGGTPTNGKSLSVQRSADYITSANCKECHAAEYESWHDSYHRTMTQRATRETVVAPIEDVRLHSRRRDYRLYRKDDQFRVQMVDPDWEMQQLLKGLPIDGIDDPPVIDRQIVMTTGSHHYQAFWISGQFGNEFRQVPFIYHIATQQWIPREDSFLQLSSHEREFALWNDNCVICHTVGGRPGFDILKNTYDSKFVELGISCEACHGPGGEHAKAHKRLNTASEGSNPKDMQPDIINPSQLDKERAAAICGQCHADFYPKNRDDWNKNGYAESFRPGELLEESRVIVRYSVARELSDGREVGQGLDAGESVFWKDGAIRVGGREYNGLIESACYQRGEMTCLSCHSLHNYHEPNDQLSRNLKGNETCLQCHEDYRDRISEHTHHMSESTGSLCYNCHMPHTSYALFKAIRSHRIDSPGSRSFVESGRPNACNLCHLDQTLSWTVDHLREWYGQPDVPLDNDSKTIAASILWLLKGDAAQRTISVWSTGWNPAKAVSRNDWQIPYVAELLADPYAAIRFMSARALESLNADLNSSYNFVGTAEEWTSERDRVIKAWQRTKTAQNPERHKRLLLDPNGIPKRNEVDRLIQLRDNRRIVIAE